MPPSDGRAGSICVYLITSFFFISIVAGGVLLVLYITVPVSNNTAWFPIAGMILVGIPWAFWIFTCIYRSVAANPFLNPSDRAPIRSAAVAPAVTASGANSPINGQGAGVESPVNLPGGARRVRFGNATVSAGTEEGAGRGGGGGGQGGDGESHTGGSSGASHESEKQLAL